VATTYPVTFFTIDDGPVGDPAVVGSVRDEHISVAFFPVPSATPTPVASSPLPHGASVQDHTVTHANRVRHGFDGEETRDPRMA
jgi:hypothetical protein